MFYKAPAVVPWDGATMSDVVASVRVHPELAVLFHSSYTSNLLLVIMNEYTSQVLLLWEPRSRWIPSEMFLNLWCFFITEGSSLLVQWEFLFCHSLILLYLRKCLL